MSHRLPPMVHATAKPASPNQDGLSASRFEKLGELNSGGEKPGLPKAFKFGQVDHNMLMSRLYSTPLNNQPIQSNGQKYMLDMSMTSMQKPRIKKLEAPPPHPEPIVGFIWV